MDNETTLVEDKPVDKVETAVTEVVTPETEVKTEATAPEEKATDQAEEKPKREAHVVRRLYKYMERAAKAEQELAAIKAKTVTAPVEPQRVNFANDSDYVNAVVDHKIAQKLPQVQQVQTPTTSVEEVKKAYADYDEVMEDAEDVTIPDNVVPTVTQSPVFEHLRYYLTKHPDEAKALYTMSPARAAAAVGKIEAKIEGELDGTKAKPEVKVSKAPAPITPLKVQGASGKVDENKLSDQEWFRLERQRTMERNKKRFVTNKG
jgi:hypothetical protein